MRRLSSRNKSDFLPKNPIPVYDIVKTDMQTRMKALSVKLPSKTVAQLKQLAANETLERGVFVSVGKLIRDAIDDHLVGDGKPFLLNTSE